jgi:hypothetical protein
MHFGGNELAESPSMKTCIRDVVVGDIDALTAALRTH